MKIKLRWRELSSVTKTLSTITIAAIQGAKGYYHATKIKLRWRELSSVSKILSIILIAAILGAIGTLGYIIVAPKVKEKFTEFYILGLEAKAGNYPKVVVAGKETRIIVGIINREQETMSYRVEIRIDGTRNNEMGPLVLEHDEKWEETVSFTPARVGDNQKTEFLLYKNEEGEPYLEPLHLWVNVK